MKRFHRVLIALVSVYGLLFLTACGEREDTVIVEREEVGERTVVVAEETEEGRIERAWDTVSDHTADMRDAFISTMSNAGDRIEEGAANLREGAEEIPPAVEERYEVTRDAFRRYLDTAGDATEDTWERSRDTVGEAWEDFVEAYQDLREEAARD